ncbi:cytochrome c biogenesis protein ResB [Saccharopolyspora rosea]|uniref:Cytochrome c biogenesis protein ResB n=1 Tax=Saccharopolyspora rosea TaxID=524884 RepID=A0ABW3FQG3_9PSEU
MRSQLATALAFLRNTWRGLTSMRTALVLLFLLALAALPGALIPQRSLNPGEVDKYFREYPNLAPVLDKIGAFEVFGSVWFASIYVLLFISLIGCLLPRCWQHYKALRAEPVRTPRNLARMPHHAEATVDSSVDEVVAAAHRRLKGWRKVEREEDDGSRSISAERGFLREVGNLVFHFALIGLLIGVAGGKFYGYEGQVIVMADGSEFCNAGTYNYDSFRAGLRVDGTQLDPFCVRVNDYHTRYLPTGQAVDFRADLQYQSGDDLQNDAWRPYLLQVNHPLRTAGDRVYLTGNGYAPKFTVTFPNGQRRTQVVQWQPVDPTTMLSQGATKFDPPGVQDERQRRQNQIAVTGLFAPTANYSGTLLSSGFPDLLDPTVAVDVLRGDLGLDSGRGQSIFSVDQSMVANGRLKRVARQNLRVGQEVRLDDGTTVHFDGVQRWVNLQISHDPFEAWVLFFAITIVFGIGTSLIIKRRRVWVRVRRHPEDSARTVVEVGGLARTDQAGYGEEFTRLAADLLGTQDDGSPQSSAVAAGARGRKN